MVENLQIVDNTIADYRTYGLGIGAEVKGSVVIRNNAVTEVGISELQNSTEGNFIVFE